MARFIAHDHHSRHTIAAKQSRWGGIQIRVMGRNSRENSVINVFGFRKGAGRGNNRANPDGHPE